MAVKTITFLSLLALALAASLGLSMRNASALKEECRRLASNQEAMLGQMRRYAVRDSLQAASAAIMTIRAAEAEAHFARLTALVKDMGVKMRRVEVMAQNSVRTAVDFSAPVRDTIIMERPAQALSYDNGHISLDGVVEQGIFRGNITSLDTLTQVVHRVPRRLLFIRYGTRELRQEIVSSNPHSQITYSRYIKIEK